MLNVMASRQNEGVNSRYLSLGIYNKTGTTGTILQLLGDVLIITLFI